jgi:hypothetical protein
MAQNNSDPRKCNSLPAGPFEKGSLDLFPKGEDPITALAALDAQFVAMGGSVHRIDALNAEGSAVVCLN